MEAAVVEGATVAVSLCGGTKGARRHVYTQTLKLVWKWDVMCEKCGKSESYHEDEAKSPLYKHA